MEDLKGKTALITGGAQGIGKAIGQAFLRAGMQVVVADLDEAAGQETLAELGKEGRVAFVPTDVGDESSVASAVQAACARWGDLHALVNNAAIATAHTGPPEELDLQQWNRVLTTNLTGCFLCAKHATPHLRKQGGSIVNVASTRALMSEPHSEAYAASKGGVVALTHALAVSLGPAVRVNCISPGWIDTGPWKRSDRRVVPAWSDVDHGQHPAGRVGRPEDVAELALYLVSGRSGFMTGQNLVLDGGMTRKMIYAQ